MATMTEQTALDALAELRREGRSARRAIEETSASVAQLDRAIKDGEIDRQQAYARRARGQGDDGALLQRLRARRDDYGQPMFERVDPPAADDDEELGFPPTLPTA